MKSQFEQRDQIHSIISKIDCRITDLQVLKGGFIMERPVLLQMLKHHPELKLEWDVLHQRKEQLRRLLWKLP